ncbi:MAG: hypothetical protein KF893_18320 [Caldilineaceae bacterium]|nr:hypothetical protein [Caldilineaceae bacterium]
MKRVQLILEEWQHDWLAAEADKNATSMSALLRDLLSEAIERRQSATLAEDPIWGIIGMAEGPNDGVTSENLDEFLYRINWSEPTLRKVAEDEPSRDR